MKRYQHIYLNLKRMKYSSQKDESEPAFGIKWNRERTENEAFRSICLLEKPTDKSLDSDVHFRVCRVSCRAFIITFVRLKD